MEDEAPEQSKEISASQGKKKGFHSVQKGYKMAKPQHSVYEKLEQKSSTEIRFPVTGGLLNSAKRPRAHIFCKEKINSNPLKAKGCQAHAGWQQGEAK